MAQSSFQLSHVFIWCCNKCRSGTREIFNGFSSLSKCIASFNHSRMRTTIVTTYNFHSPINFNWLIATKNWITSSRSSLDGFSFHKYHISLRKKHNQINSVAMEEVMAVQVKRTGLNIPRTLSHNLLKWLCQNINREQLCYTSWTKRKQSINL